MAGSYIHSAVVVIFLAIAAEQVTSQMITRHSCMTIHSFWISVSWTTCYANTDSMCCSSLVGQQTSSTSIFCCNAAQYGREFSSSSSKSSSISSWRSYSMSSSLSRSIMTQLDYMSRSLSRHWSSIASYPSYSDRRQTERDRAGAIAGAVVFGLIFLVLVIVLPIVVGGKAGEKRALKVLQEQRGLNYARLNEEQVNHGFTNAPVILGPNPAGPQPFLGPPLPQPFQGPPPGYYAVSPPAGAVQSPAVVYQTQPNPPEPQPLPEPQGQQS